MNSQTDERNADTESNVIDMWEWKARQRHPAGKALIKNEANSSQA